MRLFVFSGLVATSLLVHGCGTTSDSTTDPGGSDAGDAGSAGNGKGGAAGTAQGGSGGKTGGSGGGTGGTGGSGANGGGQTGGYAGTAGTGGSSEPPDADTDVDFTYDAPVSESGLEDACVDELTTAEPVPLDIYFMLDVSTSMSQPHGSGASGDCDVNVPSFSPTVNSRWCKAINAVAGYVSSPAAAGNRAAIQYFTHYTHPSCDGGTVGQPGYATPFVELGVLTGSYSGHAQVIVEQAYGGLNWAYPKGLTPTEGALRGLAKFTAANQSAGRIIIGILVTDGEPVGSCNNTDSVLRGIAQDHFNATGIHTFMVGISGASFTRLETWASYTGAIAHDDTNDACGNCNNCTCHHYNVGDGSPAVFIDALNRIQQSVLSCTFKVPQPAQGILDPNLVAVDYFPSGQPPAIQLPRVNSAAECAGEGWYYDNPTNPSTINLCPQSCDVVQADKNAEIKIRIACEGS